jgi:superfamily II DNA or RNA helicase
VLIQIKEPTKVSIPKPVSPLLLDQLKVGLTYTDKKASYALSRFKQYSAKWYPDEEEFNAKLAEMKAATKVCLLFEEEDHYWTYSGLSNYVKSKVPAYTGCQTVPDGVKLGFTYPDPKPLPWDKAPGYEMYPFQKEALEKLLAVKHGGVQIGTGLGKSFIIANLVKRLGLKTLIMAPSSSITEQLIEEFTKLFGKKYVGAYYENKKDVKKLIVIGNAQSFTRVKEDSPAWKELSKTQVFIADESHQTPAKTLASVCFGLVKNAPYRFFFSATQMRNDGADLVLEGITGPMVFEMTVKEGVEKGYLARPKFKVLRAPMNGSYWHDDPNFMTRHHLLYNPKVVEAVGKLVNAAVTAGFPTLVLIDEVEQFTKLLPYVKGDIGFAHGPLTDDNRDKVPADYQESKPKELVDRFNAGELPILVGTSCIQTGTNIKPVKFLVYWAGGSSEIQVKQAIGRGTRLSPGKTFCHVVDFMVDDHREKSDGRLEYGPVGRHGEIRHAIYDELCGPVTMGDLP